MNSHTCTSTKLGKGTMDDEDEDDEADEEEERQRRLGRNSASEEDEGGGGGDDNSSDEGVDRLLERIHEEEAGEMRRQRQRQRQQQEEQEEDEDERATGDDDDADDVARLEAMLLTHGKPRLTAGGVSDGGEGDVGGMQADRFEEEQACQGYGENLFPADPVMLPGPSLHGAAGFAYAPLSALALPPGFDPATMAHQPGSGSFLQQQQAAAAAMLISSGGGGGGLHASLCPRPLKAVMAEVAGMDVAQLHEALLAAEATLAVLHARAALVKLFHAALNAASKQSADAHRERLRSLQSSSAAASALAPSATLNHAQSAAHSSLLCGDGPACRLSPEVVVQLVRLLCLRGVQLPPTSIDDAHGVARLAPRDIVTHASASASLPPLPPNSLQPSPLPPLAPPSSSPCPVAAAPLTATAVMRSALVQMLRQNATVPSSSTSSPTAAWSGSGGGLAPALLNAALDDLEAAALIDVFGDTPWFSRTLCASDSQAMLQPSVELAWWLLDLLLAPLYYPAATAATSSSDAPVAAQTAYQPAQLGPHPCVVSGAVLFRLGHCLRSGNMPVKEVAMRALTRIAVHWCDRLEAAAPEDRAACAAVLQSVTSLTSGQRPR
mmetsp:Transcript_8575/g.14495  ORF Transcript_8575/g.14495 Transcript_8575/m.14495 type:complete len:608 (-) Transcript_8575:220-2043(-)